MIINQPWFRCKACDAEIVPHIVKIHQHDEEDESEESSSEQLEQWEWLCTDCKAHVPVWNPRTEQWNNDNSSVRFNSSGKGDALGELLHTLHNGGSTGGTFNSLD